MRLKIFLNEGFKEMVESVSLLSPPKRFKKSGWRSCLIEKNYFL